MNSPCSVTYLARMGGGTYHHKTFHSTFLWQHTVQPVHGPWQCYRMLHLPAALSASTGEPLCLPSSTQLLWEGNSAAVGPTVSQLPRKTPWGIFPLSLPSIVTLVQGCENNPGAGLAAQKAQALQQWETSLSLEWVWHIMMETGNFRYTKPISIRSLKAGQGTGNILEPWKQCQEQNHRIMSGSFD